jgi:hypothetical protein
LFFFFYLRVELMSLEEIRAAILAYYCTPVVVSLLLLQWDGMEW